MNKILLYIQIRKFYNTFNEVVGENFITALSDMTDDNVLSVAFDINEVLQCYDHSEADEMYVWCNKLLDKVNKYCNISPLSLNSILFRICNTNKNGYYELRRGTAPIYKLAQWLYKKGVI